MKFLTDLGITVKNEDLLMEALTHSSYANEHSNTKYYERLEFLGDAVLELVVSEYLYKNYEQDEGDMTKKRANYVCEDANYEYMNKLGIIKFIKVGNGEVGNVKKAIVADIFEAFVGAIYLDQGFPKAQEFILNIVTPYIIDNVSFFNDYKSILQEAVQTDRRSLLYELVEETGPAHDKRFTIAVRIDDVVYGKGTASSKKEACQLAAKKALEKLAKRDYE